MHKHSIAGARGRAFLAGATLAALTVPLGAHEHGTHSAILHVHEADGVTRSVAHYQVPDVMLLDSSGAPAPLLAQLDTDAPVLLNFVFTSCTAVCPVQSATFAQLQAQLAAAGQRFRMLSIDIDPEQDTPARLRDYARKYQAGPDWRFLTGKPDDIIAVQRAFAAYRGGKMNHAPLTLLRATRQAPWVRVEGFASAAALLHAYRQAPRS